MTPMQEVEIIRRLIKESSIVARIWEEYFFVNPVKLYLLMNDDEAYSSLLNERFMHGFDIFFANLLTSGVSIPTGLLRILSSKVRRFQIIFTRNIQLPLRFET